MKIEGPKKTDAAKSKDKSKSVSTGDDSFKTLLGGGAQESKSASASQSIASLDVLLAAQSTEDPAQGRAKRKMVDRGERILDSLERMRMALLTGSLTVGHLVSLADVVASHREKITDPQLLAVIDEIDLRAQIEMAKMARAYDMAAPKP
jgi:hypothetical protein